jgi:hypothetical protein
MQILEEMYRLDWVEEWCVNFMQMSYEFNLDKGNMCQSVFEGLASTFTQLAVRLEESNSARTPLMANRYVYTFELLWEGAHIPTFKYRRTTGKCLEAWWNTRTCSANSALSCKLYSWFGTSSHDNESLVLGKSYFHACKYPNSVRVSIALRTLWHVTKWVVYGSIKGDWSYIEMGLWKECGSEGYG